MEIPFITAEIPLIFPVYYSGKFRPSVSTLRTVIVGRGGVIAVMKELDQGPKRIINIFLF